MFLLKNERITKGDLRDSFLEGRKIEKIAGFPPHNGQKKNKLSTLHMCLIKIGFLKFKQPKHSISGKNPANNYMNFFTPCCSFTYAIKRHKNKGKVVFIGSFSFISVLFHTI